MFSRAVAYGNMLFLAGVGYHKPGTIEDHTSGVLEEIKKNLEDAGSSLQKCLKVSVFLADLKDYDRMNAVYRSLRLGLAAAGAHHHGRRGRSRQFADRNRRHRLYLRGAQHGPVRQMVAARPFEVFRCMAAGAMAPIARCRPRRRRRRRIAHTGTDEGQSLHPHRRAADPQRARHLHHPQRLALPAGSQAGHVRGLALLRPDGRDDGRRRQGTGPAERL